MQRQSISISGDDCMDEPRNKIPSTETTRRHRLSKEQKKEIDKEWLKLPARVIDVQFNDDVSQPFAFLNAIYNGCRGQKCQHPGCSAPDIRNTSDHHAQQHAKKHHVPRAASMASRQKQAMGTRGSTIMSTWLGSCRQQGSVDAENDSNRARIVAQCKEQNITPPPLVLPSPVTKPTAISRSVSDRSEIPEIANRITPRLKIQQLLHEIAELQQILSPDVVIKEKTACAGVQLRVPCPFLDHYPFQLHASGDPIVTWSVPDEDGTVYSLRCLGWSHAERCAACSELGTLVSLREVQQRANSLDLHLTTINDTYLTPNQLKLRLGERRRMWRMYRLDLYRAKSQLTKFLRVSNDYDRLLSNLARDNIPRFQQVLQRLLKRHARPSTILKVVNKIAGGEYKPRIEFTQDEMEKSTALLIMGGPRALKLEQATAGGPGIRHVQDHPLYLRPRFIACNGQLKDASLIHNAREFLRSTPTPMQLFAWHIAFDNVALDERFRYTTHGGELLGGLRGVARESAFSGSYVIRSQEDVDFIQQEITAGRILPVKEMTVIVAIRNSSPPLIVPLYASGTAKNRGSCAGELQAKMLGSCLEIWNREVAPTFGEIISCCSDHDSANGKTMDSLRLPMVSGRRRSVCARLPLFDLEEGPRGVVPNFDDQHNGKNYRAKLIWKSGFIIHRTHFTREKLILLVTTMTGVSQSSLNGYWPPPGLDDHQNVASMSKGFKLLAGLWEMKVEDAKINVPPARIPGLTQELIEIQPLAFVAKCWTFLFTRADASLSEHLQNCARLAVAIFIMRRHNKKTLPAQLYTAIMTSVMRLVKDILACQEKNYTTYYIFIAATHLLEQIFGVLRTQCPAMRNFDFLQFEERMSYVVTLQSIMERHPDWRRGPKRISRSFDHWNTKSWEGAVNPQDVNVENMWKSGMMEAASGFAALQIYSKEETDIDALLSKFPNMTLLNPGGSAPGTRHCADEVNDAAADMRDSDEELDDTDEELDDTDDTPGIGVAACPSEGGGNEHGGTAEMTPVTSSVLVDFEEAISEEHEALISDRNNGSLAAMDTMSSNAKTRSPESLSIPSYIVNSNGERCYIARLVSQMSKESGELLKTTSRVGPGGGRVGGAPIHGKNATEVEMDDESEELRLFANDHCLCILLIDGIPTGVIGEISMIVVSGGRCVSSHGATAEEQIDTATKLTIRPLQSSVKDDELLFSGESSGAEVNITGPFTQAVTPGVRRDNGRACLVMPIPVVDQITKGLWLRVIEAGANSRLVKGDTCLKHRNQNMTLFTVGAAEAASMKAGHPCSLPGCNFKAVDMNTVLNHASYHRLHTPNLITNDEPCPLCHGDSTCAIMLEKTGSDVLQPRIFCVQMNPGAKIEQRESCVKFSAKHMNKSTQNLPSSNCPLVCPACYPHLAKEDHLLDGAVVSSKKKKVSLRPAVMKYNMETHWRKHHRATTMPPALKQDLSLGENERHWLKLNQGCKISASQAKKKTTTNAAISPAGSKMSTQRAVSQPGPLVTSQLGDGHMSTSAGAQVVRPEISHITHWSDQFTKEGYHVVSACPSQSAPWNMRPSIVVCRLGNGSIVSGDLFPKIRAQLPTGTEYMNPNATLNVAGPPICTYEILISPETYGDTWVACEKSLAAGVACSIQGGCRYPQMALGYSHFCAECKKGPLHALCCLELTGQDTIRVCSTACFETQTTRI